MKPFVKWVGGKSRLVRELLKNMPPAYKTYREPFVGGGALFLSAKPVKAELNDMNVELIKTWSCFKDKDSVALLEKLLDSYENKETVEGYEEIRSQDRQQNFIDRCNPFHAARLIYLSKMCFNGLYRVNPKGFFNSPYNHATRVKLYEHDNFSEILDYFSQSDINLTTTDFEEAMYKAEKDDFMYLDPPYDKTYNGYTSDCFSEKDLRRLHHAFYDLDKKGVKLMLSESDTTLVKELFGSWRIIEFDVSQTISRNNNGRKKKKELLILNY